MSLFNFRRPKKKAAAAAPPQPRPTPVSSLKQSLLSLEQRLMFDAAAAATAAEVASEHVAQEQADAAVSTESSHETTSAETAESQDVLKALATYMPTESRTEVVFVDPTVPNYQDLLAGMDPNIEIIMLDAGKDGVQQIAENLAGRTGVDAIHLISHGNAGELQLGTSHLTQESMMGQYANELTTIRQAMSEQADLLVYGCNFAEGEQGQRATATLSELTGADVQASVDLTGHESRGGDWQLEYRVGQVETSLAINQVAQENWMEILRGEKGEDAHSRSDKDSKDPDNREHKESKDRGDREGKEGKDKRDHGDGHKESNAWGDRSREDGERGHENSAPTITSDGGKGSATLRVHENTTFVTKVTARDSDAGQALEFRIVGGTDASKFTIDQTTGELRFITASSYEMPGDRGSDNVYHVKVQVSDGFGKKDTQTIKVIVTDVNEDPTNLTVSASTVAENAAPGTVVGMASTTDPDAGDTHTYQLTNNAGGRFAINASTGVITVADGSLLNYEAAASHSITVRTTDAGGLTQDQTFTINLTNVNEAPTGLALSASTVAENAVNGTVVGTAAVTDDTHTYQLTDTAGGRFAINASTGVITVADGTLLNYEAATSHTVTVRVTDSSGATYDEAFAITLTNVNEAPTVTSNGGGATASVTVAENQTAVTTVTASDADAGTTLTCSISGGADAARFAIDSGTGALRFATAPNFERATDIGRNNVYEVTVRVSDGQGGTATQAISVRVTDVNEAPRITSNRGGDVAAVTIRENSTTVTTVRATDPDRGGTLSYSVVGGADASLFTINSRTGYLRFVSAPNFEQPTDADGNNAYQVVVQASDGRGGIDTQTINVTVTDRNDVPHELDFTGGTVREGAPNGTIVGQAIVADEDRVDTHTYSLVDNAGGRFVVHPRTGIITVADAALLDYNSATSHTISVRVIDAGRLTRTETFTINLTNVNETPTNILLSGNTVAENAAAGLVVGQASTVDPDAGDTHAYTLTNDAGGRFSIDPHTGEITVATGALLDHEQTSSRTITVRSTDSGGLMRDQTFAITVSNVNEAPTALNLSGNTVAENAVSGTVVGTASVIDPDAGDTHIYQLTDTAGGRFAINSSTGVITVADSALVNYGSTSNFNIAVRVTDSGSQIHEQTFTISKAAGSLPGPLAPIALPSIGVHQGAGPSSPDPSRGEAGEGFRPPEDLRNSQNITTETPLLVEALSPERAPTQSAPLEYLDGSLENSRDEELLERFSSQSGESGRIQGQTGSATMRTGEGRPADAKESEQGPVQADASAETDVAMTVGIAGVVLQSGLLPKEKLTALSSRLRGNVPPPISGHDVGPDGPRPDGEESPSRHSSGSDDPSSS